MAETSKQEHGKTELDRAMAKTMEEANAVFAKLRTETESLAKKGGALDLLEVAKAAGLGLEAKDLEELHIDRLVSLAVAALGTVVPLAAILVLVVEPALSVVQLLPVVVVALPLDPAVSCLI